MPKVLSITGLVVSAALLLLFGMDLALKIPFGRTGSFMFVDVVFVICSLILGYLSWTTYREQV